MAPARLSEVPSKKNYIPVGTLKVSKEECEIPDDAWNLENLDNSTAWTPLDEAAAHSPQPSKSNGICTTSNGNGNGVALKPKWLASLLLTIPQNKEIAKLAKERWIRLEYRIFKQLGHHVIVRVYILPDDMDRRILDRCDQKLRKARHSLLLNLDYSKEAWSGQILPGTLTGCACPIPTESDANDCDSRSLLELFNNIPSPDPRPEAITDPYVLDAIDSLLSSNVAGLTSTLYTYQRRSAALMLQRETNPGKVLDPRLVPVLDQENETWYIDQPAGVVLREPRHYNGVLGGVLAEEMGSGKTIICLSLILATKNFYSPAPDIYRGNHISVRKKVGSLMDMAAASTTRNSITWQAVLKAAESQHGYDLSRCIRAIERNPGVYALPADVSRRASRRSTRLHRAEQAPQHTAATIYISKTNLVVVPNNLVKQWEEEIKKHTTGLEVLTITTTAGEIPAAVDLLEYDIILFSQTKFESLHKVIGQGSCPLSRIHFKRCIVDEGHRLGNSRISHKSNLLLGLECLHFSSRWIVTGTPSQGLFGVEGKDAEETSVLEDSGSDDTHPETILSRRQEMQDITRLSSMISLYLKASPWANISKDIGDPAVDWAVYAMRRRECLSATLNSLIIRHRLSEVGHLLPPVDEKVVVLEGSYQDKLSLNIFSMMIIFNSVQSQRTDRDYFFHPKQKKAVHELLQNLKQASFFGGSFYDGHQLEKAIKIAEEFLEKKNTPISAEDDSLLREAIAFGHVARNNELRNASNSFHELPLYVSDFPGASGEAWSLESKGGDIICSGPTMLAALQKLIRKHLDDPAELNALLNGGLVEAGKEEKIRAEHGNHEHGVRAKDPENDRGKDVDDRELHAALAKTRVVSTVSAKLSYLVDAIIKYQAAEQILVFYENENVAYYIASMLDVLQIQYLIYAKTLTAERKSQYVNSFNHTPKFRVLLMDITQAAFGLDMKAASRIYFLHPVLNPQVEAQAIARARRISQDKPVTVETLVLRGSIEEIIMSRKKSMTQAEHWKCKSLLDDKPIHNWVSNARILPLPDQEPPGHLQTVPLQTPQLVFGKGFGRIVHWDDDLLVGSPTSIRTHHQAASSNGINGNGNGNGHSNGVKRPFDVGPGIDATSSADQAPLRPPKKRSVRFAVDTDED